MKSTDEILALIEARQFDRLDRFDLQALLREQERLESQAELVQSARRLLAAKLPIRRELTETSWNN